MIPFLKKWRVILLSVLVFIVFKFFFPNPDIFSDSMGYLQAGLDETPVSFRPYGYSVFLMFFSGMSSNYINIIVVQFILFALSCWYFNTTIFKVFNISPRLQWIFWLLTLFNPIGYFLLNLISTDSLFTDFTMIWLATLLRYIFYQEKRYLVLGLHIVVFYLLFNLRYNGLYYPFFSVAIVLLTSLKLREKLVYAGMVMGVFGMVYNGISSKVEDQYGVKTLSGLGGWAMLNNAAHIYENRVVDSNIFDEPDDKLLHQFMVTFKDSFNKDRLASGITDRYIWANPGPLKRYLYYSLQTGRYPDYLTGWWNVSVMYNDFGKKLIRQYPGTFLSSFYIPNLLSYPKAESEVLKVYGSAHFSLSPRYQDYFDYHQDTFFTAKYPEAQRRITSGVEFIYYVPNILSFLAGLAGIIIFLRLFIKKKGKDIGQPQWAMFILCSFHVITILLLALAIPLMLRYTSMSVIYFAMLPLLLLIATNDRIKAVFTKGSEENSPT